MGRRGPVPQESALDRSRQQRVAEEPEEPKGLTPEARKEWRRIVGLLRARNGLDALDGAALADYVVCWQRLRDAEREISKNGLMVKTSGRSKRLVRNPLISIAKVYRAALVAWAKELGLSIGARARLHFDPAPTPAQTDLERLLSGPELPRPGGQVQ